MAGTDRHAVHRTMVLVDVEGFGSPARTLPHQLGTRAGMYDVVAEAFGRRECRGRPCYHEDRGDSVLVLVPPEYPKAPGGGAARGPGPGGAWVQHHQR